MRRKIIFIDVDGPLAWATWGDGKLNKRDNFLKKYKINFLLQLNDN